MKIITLWQPWASLIALGLKHYETRSWGTQYRGKLAIHAAKRLTDIKTISDLQDRFPEIREKLWHFSTAKNYTKVETELLPLGSIVAVVDLSDCKTMSEKHDVLSGDCHALISDQSLLERGAGDWSQGRYAWKLENVAALAKPIPYKGGQGLRTVASIIEQQILESIAND